MDSLTEFLKAAWQRRPWWMNLMLLFCAYMTFIYTPFDLIFKDIAIDEDVWLGFTFTGWGAKIGGFFHFLVYALGTWGFWHMKSWMHPWAAVYLFQVAIAFFLFPIINPEVSDYHWIVSVVVAAPWVLFAIVLLLNRKHFQSSSEVTETEGL